MKYWNEYDIEYAYGRFERSCAPVAMTGALIVARLASWTNQNSDGWAYWLKPVRAAKNLLELLDSLDRYAPVDITPSQLKKACTPIKSFLTRQGVDHELIFGSVK